MEAGLPAYYRGGTCTAAANLAESWLCVPMHRHAAVRGGSRCESSDPPPPLTTDASFGWLRTADAANSTDHHTEEAYCTSTVGSYR